MARLSRLELAHDGAAVLEDREDALVERDRARGGVDAAHTDSATLGSRPKQSRIAFRE